MVNISPAFQVLARVVGVLTAMMIHRFFQSASNLRQTAPPVTEMAEACRRFVIAWQERNQATPLELEFGWISRQIIGTAIAIEHGIP